MATPRPERPRQSQNMPYAMGDINTAAADADFGNSLFIERCGVQATVWRHRAVFGPVDNRPTRN